MTFPARSNQSERDYRCSRKQTQELGGWRSIKSTRTTTSKSREGILTGTGESNVANHNVVPLSLLDYEAFSGRLQVNGNFAGDG